MSTLQEKLRPLLAQFGRFLVVGGISFSVDFGLFTVLYGLGVPHLIASATSFSTSVVLNYILSRRYVFEAQEMSVSSRNSRCMFCSTSSHWA